MATKALATAPPDIQEAFDEGIDRWRARVRQDWRFYFTIKSGGYHTEEIRPHPK